MEVDAKKRKEILDKVQEIFYNEYPVLPMYDRVNIHSLAKKVKGIRPSMAGGMTGLMWNVNEWSIEG